MSIVPRRSTINYTIKSVYWFAVGFILSAALFSSAILFYFQYAYRDRVIPGVFIGNTYIGEKNKGEIEKIFKEKNESIAKNTIVFSTEDIHATVSARILNAGYDINLITDQGLSLGKTKNLLSDAYIILSSYVNGTFLSSSFTFDEILLRQQLEPIQKRVYREPVNAEFKVNNNKVVAFKQSLNGRSIDYENINEQVQKVIPGLDKGSPGIYNIDVKIKEKEPEITTEE